MVPQYIAMDVLERLMSATPSDDAMRQLLDDAQFEINFLRTERDVWVVWDTKQRARMQAIKTQNSELQKLVTTLAAVIVRKEDKREKQHKQTTLARAIAFLPQLHWRTRALLASFLMRLMQYVTRFAGFCYS